MRKFLIWSLTIVVILFAFDQVMRYSHYKEYYSGKKFSKEAWIEADKKYKESYGICGQCAMYHDLVTNHLKKGMTLREIEDLLGDDGLKYYCLGNKKIKCVSYSLGLCYADWAPSFGDVVICFDERHNAIDFGRARDLNKKYCSKGKIYCEGKPKCECYIKDKLNGEECDSEVERW